jgi:hypothetical protein
MPLEEFYKEYTALWRHAMNVRYKMRGKARTYLQLGAAVATGKVSLKEVKKGWNMAKVMSDPDRFVQRHHDSEAALARSGAGA